MTSQVVYSENSKREADKLAERAEQINFARAEAEGVTPDGLIVELAYRVASSESDLEAVEWLVRLDEVVDDLLLYLADAGEEKAAPAKPAAPKPAGK